MATVTELRFYVYHPIIDFVKHIIELDGVYAVNEFPPLPPVPVDNFETYANSNDLNTTWQLFGDAGVSLTLTTNKDSVANGSKAAVLTYKAAPGTQYALIRRNNIIPGLNFSNLKGGIQFWLKGDGSSNNIIFRFFNGNEMWASNPISLNSTTWKHIGIPFVADSVNGFRYLGNDPTNPVWSSNIGTNEQLYGDLANVDQIYFEIMNPEQNNTTYSIVLDNIEGVDQFAGDIVVTSVDSKDNPTAPKQFSLSQNYPNPFNPSTVIRYELPKSALVTLQIYNILGQKVAELVNQKQNAGTHEVTFHASQLSSGVYFYSIKAGNFVSTRKMLLLK